ncbi:DUF5067 domain-containing protein [Staphylococcus ratti]|uniref:DUF5067 domain-containing protein n=1 Tax=Staphylococcus ratti TaxID=2892440 RepID=A0ABY3PDQ3_9STAP|nr:DUF5067 domain-containing protein [Staphylococcus ratti]UEX90373.1 DUF5067 domain-containing protein [Staphylococcus ratti]
MKKALTLLFLSLLLVACGNGEEKENTIETLELSKAEKYKPDGEFKDKKVIRKDFEIEFEKLEFPEGKNIDDKNIKAASFEYSVKNKQDKKIYPSSAWITSIDVYQVINGKEKELKPTIMKDDRRIKDFPDTHVEIKKGGKAKGFKTFELIDKTSPIIIVAKNSEYETIGAKKIELKEKKSNQI